MRQDAPSFSSAIFAQFYREQHRSARAKRTHRQAMHLVWALRGSLITLRGCPRLSEEQARSGIGWRRVEGGLYFLWRGPVLLYVGRSRDLRKRLMQHARKGWPTGSPDSLTVLRAERRTAALLEAVFIERLKPLRNTRKEKHQLRRARGLLYPYRLLAGFETFGAARALH